MINAVKYCVTGVKYSITGIKMNTGKRNICRWKINAKDLIKNMRRRETDSIG